MADVYLSVGTFAQHSVREPRCAGSIYPALGTMTSQLKTHIVADCCSTERRRGDSELRAVSARVCAQPKPGMGVGWEGQDVDLASSRRE